MCRSWGRGVVGPCREGWKIGPLFAGDGACAERLLSALAGIVPGAPVIRDLPGNTPMRSRSPGDERVPEVLWLRADVSRPRARAAVVADHRRHELG